MNKVLIVGGGTMGNGIAALFGSRGWSVQVVEVQEERRRTLESAVRQIMVRMGDASPSLQLTILDSIEQVEWADVRLVIETVNEDLDVKRSVFRQLDASCPQAIPLASNSSAFPISSIAEGLSSQSRMLGLHFFMPAQLVPAVEVISGAHTSGDVLDAVCELMLGVGKKPVRVQRDVPGFLANRIQHALMREAIALVEEGFATAEDVDTAVRFGFGFRYIAAGPLLQKDLAGIDIHYAAAKTMYPYLHNDVEPSSYMKGLVDRGETGIKSEKLQGFYQWTPESANRENERYERALLKALKILDEE